MLNPLPIGAHISGRKHRFCVKLSFNLWLVIWHFALAFLCSIEVNASLFQDLPNYAQHTALPQEWLWCESWCGNSTKSKAKTIDLCNNPMTKEPKLLGAKRIVAERPDLDIEARRFTSRILGAAIDIQEQVLPSNQIDTASNSLQEDMAEL